VNLFAKVKIGPTAYLADVPFTFIGHFVT